MTRISVTIEDRPNGDVQIDYEGEVKISQISWDESRSEFVPNTVTTNYKNIDKLISVLTLIKQTL